MIGASHQPHKVRTVISRWIGFFAAVFAPTAAQAQTD